MRPSETALDPVAHVVGGVMMALSLLGPVVLIAQGGAHHAAGPGADSSRAHLGAMAVGLLTTANPALLGRRYTEGYLTQPNLMGDAVLGPARFTGTLNFEGYTLRRGELNAGMYGEGDADRQHPHTLVHEAMLAVATPSRAGLRGTRVAPFLEVARAAARAQRTPAVFVPAEFYGSATQWSLSLGARIHAGPLRRRMGRYVLPAGGRPSAFTASPTHP